MRAPSDALLTSLLPPDTIKSDKANQLKISKKSISLIMDGGTVNHTKWLVVGFSFGKNEEINFQILETFVFEKAKAENIKEEVEKNSNKIKSKYKGKIVA